jgi:hypothetical protein
MSVRLNKVETVEAYIHGILRGEVIEHRDSHPIGVIKPTSDLMELGTLQSIIHQEMYQLTQNVIEPAWMCEFAF